jgi:hypothetical protein
MMSVMLFDAPGSTESRPTWVLFWCVTALPFAWLLGAGAPWIFYKKRWSIALYSIPLVDLAAVFVVVLAISKVCAGSLSCK